MKKKFTIKEIAKQLADSYVELEATDKGIIKYSTLPLDLRALLRELTQIATLSRIEEELRATHKELNQTLNQIWAELVVRPKEKG